MDNNGFVKDNSFILAGFSDEQARNYISLVFAGYLARKKDKRINVNDGVAQIIIMTYYSYVEKPSFDTLMRNFKRRYIYNENKVEEVHSDDERKGLAHAYDYLLKKEDLESISIYDLSWIHEELYSQTPHPEFGGQYRNHDGFISEANVDITPYYDITRQMNELNKSDEQKKALNIYNPELAGINVPDIVAKGIEITKKRDVKKIIEYISDCVKLHCIITKIHPFRDGNGRAARIFLNLLFKLVNIPPTYIENKEKDTYKELLRKAQVEGEYKDIIDFYMYKICGSIVALDINIKEDVMYSESQKNDLKNKGSK